MIELYLTIGVGVGYIYACVCMRTWGQIGFERESELIILISLSTLVVHSRGLPKAKLSLSLLGQE